jgi:hypothetical protein
MSEMVKSKEFHDLIVNGVALDGTVDWPMAGCVRALREAVKELAVNDWTPLDAAVGWMARRHPEQTPAKYGCRRWRQVLHVSGLFDIQYRDADGGGRRLWFRPRRA